MKSLAVWKTRHGGNLYRVFPYAISALAGLERHLPRMRAYVERAGRLAKILSADQRIAITPEVPQVNAFHLLLPGSVETLTDRNRAFAEKHDVWLFNLFYESPMGDHSVGEVVIGDASDDYGIPEAARWIAEFLDA